MRFWSAERTYNNYNCSIKARWCIVTCFKQKVKDELENEREMNFMTVSNRLLNDFPFKNYFHLMEPVINNTTVLFYNESNVPWKIRNVSNVWFIKKKESPISELFFIILTNWSEAASFKIGISHSGCVPFRKTKKKNLKFIFGRKGTFWFNISILRLAYHWIYWRVFFFICIIITILYVIAEEDSLSTATLDRQFSEHSYDIRRGNNQYRWFRSI